MLSTAHRFHHHLSLSAISPVAAQTMLYMWDTGYVSQIWALLDPRGLTWALDTMLAALGKGMHEHMAADARSGAGIGKWYAFNDFSFWLAADALVRLGGVELQAELAGSTLISRLNESATSWRKLLVGAPTSGSCTHGPLTRPSAGADVLASYGGNENLLEVVPTYQYVVPSLNLANAWMMRSLAEYLDGSQPRYSAQLRQWATDVHAAALTLYCEGEGVWACLQPLNGSHGAWRHVPVRHVLDFVTSAQVSGRELLPPTMRAEMLRFHKAELRNGGQSWLRALSLSDATAPSAATHRDDHGPFGSWDGWVAKSSEALGLLGAWDEALEMLRQAADATNEGPFGQSHHSFMPNNTWAARQYHKSGDWLVGEYFALCGGMFAETIVGTLFGVTAPRVGTGLELKYANESRGFNGTLMHVLVRGEMYSVHSDTTSGLSLHHEGPS